MDSNLPDVRIALGGPADNPFTAEVLAAAGPGRRRGSRRLAAGGARSGCRRPAREDAFAPGADLRGPLDLPVLIVAGGDLAAAIAAVTADLADAVIEAAGDRPAGRRRRADAGRPLGRAAQPGHAGQPGHPGRRR